MKQYIVTEKQLRRLKELTESDFYWSEEGREMRYLIEDIEAQEEPGHTALEIVAGRMAAHIATYMNSSIYDLQIIKCFEEDFTVASLFLPYLMPVRWIKVWEKALKAAEREKEGGAYVVLLEALEGKLC